MIYKWVAIWPSGTKGGENFEKVIIFSIFFLSSNLLQKHHISQGD